MVQPCREPCYVFLQNKKTLDEGYLASHIVDRFDKVWCPYHAICEIDGLGVAMSDYIK
jgi:hypothetical protein